MVKKVGERGELPEKPFSMICSVDEEDFMRGVEAAIKAGWVTKNDWILDTEPTDGQIQVAHKGRTWFELTMTGITAQCQQSMEGSRCYRSYGRSHQQHKKRDQGMPVSS